MPAITRKTDKGLPLYCDGEESDVFILAGADDLVPVLDQAGSRLTLTRTVYGTPYQIALYRPRIEGLFSRIERWTATDTGSQPLADLSRDNVTTLYGADPASTVADPADPARIFSWHICRSWDDKGNAAVYGYAAEDSAGIDQAAAHEANRTPQTRAAQIYLKTDPVREHPALLPRLDRPRSEAPLPSDWMFSVVLDYGDHTSVPPTPQPDQPWPLRPDPFSTYRSGFEVRTYRRVQRLLFFNNFPAEPTAGAGLPGQVARPGLLRPAGAARPAQPALHVRRLDDADRLPAGRPGRWSPGPCRRWSSATASRRSSRTILALDPDSQANLPEGLDGGTVPVGGPRRRGAVRDPQRRRRRLVLQAEPQRRTT